MPPWFWGLLQVIRRTWPRAEPNDGFLAQLSLFGDMRCSLDLEHPVYRMFCMAQVGRGQTAVG